MSPPGRKPSPEGTRRRAARFVSLGLLPSELALINAARLDGEALAVCVRRLTIEAATAGAVATQRAAMLDEIRVGLDEIRKRLPRALDDWKS